MARQRGQSFVSGIRIIGGHLRGRRLPSPPDRSIRPTSDRARESLFDVLDHGGLDHGGLVEEARFLDLFCGTGAVGLEAFSRGAKEVWLIDRDITQIRAAVEMLGRPEAVHVQRADATGLGRAPGRFDVVFLDPPYRSGLARPALEALDRGWLADDALIVVELAAKEGLELPPGFEMEQERRYGAARFVFLRSRAGDARSKPS